MSDFWQSLPQYKREVDISPEDWSRYFDFWDELPKAELKKPAHRFDIGIVVALRLMIVAAYIGIVAWLIWHFV